MQRCEFAYRSRKGKSQEVILCSTVLFYKQQKVLFIWLLRFIMDSLRHFLGYLLAIFTHPGHAAIVIQENEKQYHVETNFYCFPFLFFVLLIFRLSVVIVIVSIIAENFARNSFTGCV